jgi:hypothetical protein
MVGDGFGHTPEVLEAGLKRLPRNARYLIVAAVAILSVVRALSRLPALGSHAVTLFTTPISLPVYSSLPIALKPFVYGAAGFLTFLTAVSVLRSSQMLLAGLLHRTHGPELHQHPAPQPSRPAERPPAAPSADASPSPSMRHALLLDVTAVAASHDSRSRLRPHFSGLRRRSGDHHLDHHYTGPYRRSTDPPPNQH